MSDVFIIWTGCAVEAQLALAGNIRSYKRKSVLLRISWVCRFREREGIVQCMCNESGTSRMC